MGLLDGKVAVMTGGGGGLGRCYGLALAKAGAGVAVSDINLETAQATADVIREAGGKAIAVRADVTSAAAFEQLFDRTEREVGPVDILLNLAGMYPKSTVADMSEEQWDAVIALNLKSVFLGARTAIRRMVPRGRGVILSAASGTAARGIARGSAYTASKAGIISFTRSAAVELIGTGVRINCFAPGPTDTALWREGKKEEDVKSVVAAGKVFLPDEFSNVVVLLASDLSAPLSGEFINRELYR